MFQNLADNLNTKDKDVDENREYKFEKIKKLVNIQNIIIYVLSFFIAAVTLRGGITPFGFALFVAICSSAIPAGPVGVLVRIVGAYFPWRICFMDVYFNDCCFFNFHCFV